MAEKNIVHNDQHTVLAVTSSAVIRITTDQSPTVTQEKKTGNRKPWVPCGTNNLLPQEIAEDVRPSTILPTALGKTARMFYSGGLIYGKLNYDENGEEKFMPLLKERPEILRFLRKGRFEKNVRDASLNLSWYDIYFVEFIKSNDGSKIARLKVHPFRECRIAWPNERTGRIEFVYINANWKNDPNGLLAKKVAFIDEDVFDPVEALRKNKAKNIVMAFSMPSIDTKYYPLASWDSVRKSGWLKFSLQIPTFKEAVMKHQTTLKYQVDVSIEYFLWRYPTYKEKTEKEQTAIRQKFINELDENIVGPEKAGKMLMNIVHRDQQGNAIPGITITAIEDKLKDGIYIEDSQEASSHLYAAIDMDPAIIGTGKGGGMDAGSGSNKGVAQNIKTRQRRPYQDLLAEPYRMMSEYNEWETPEEPIIWRFRISFMQTESNRQNVSKNT